MAHDPSESSRKAKIDAALREMFEALSAQPVPSRLLSVIDQLDEDKPSETEPNPDRRRPRRA